jgi:hypothetical protein
MRDFTRQPRVIEIKIDDDVFRCHPRLPAQVLMDFAVKADKMGDNPTGEQGMQAMLDVLQATLIPEHYTRFRERMQDTGNPIELDQVNEIVPWIMEQYGLRPTAPSGDSSGGPSSQEPGISSTANISPVASISASSPSIAS